MQLKEERLRAEKETVKSGEVALRKEVVTEQKSIDVPVTHEEVVVERHPVEGRRPATGDIREGETIAQPLREARIVDDIVVNMIDVGEETGELDTMLNKIADNYDEEVEVLVESLVSLLEPIMIVVLGGIVGFIVIALFMPLIQLITKLSG